MPIIGILDSAKTGNLGISIDALVIAGGASGGSGGANFGGGGGAGGVIAFTNQTIALDTAFPVIVGAGGARVSQLDGNNGGNSQFASLTAAVGGGGGAGSNTPTLNRQMAAFGGSGIIVIRYPV